jgi:PAS domain S-box-containing protein
MTFSGPYVATTIALVGFALFAVIHHVHLWHSRRERSSLLFAACCLPAAGICAAHAAGATAESVEAAQVALNLRTTLGLLTHLALAWLIASISGVRSAAYLWSLSALLLGGVVINIFAFPLIGTVVRVEKLTLPWDESISLHVRSAAASAVIPRIMYAAVASVQMYALIGAWSLSRRDRTAASLMALAGVAGLLSSAVGLSVDTQVLRAPYVGQLAVSLWIILMAILLSRAHAQRGELLELSEQRSRISEARYRTMIESAPEAIVVLDLEQGHFVDFNERASELFEMPPDRLRTMGPIALSPPVQPDGRESKVAAELYLKQAVDGGTPVFEWLHRTASGHDFLCEVRLVRFPDPVRTLVRGSVSDISARVQLEARLRESQKIEAVGQLAAGVAHDFNNLLTIIAGNADLLQLQIEANDARRECVEAIQDASARAASLTERLLAFSRRNVLSPTIVELNHVVRDAEPMLRRLVGQHMQLDVRLHDGPTRVRIDPALWSQVLLNLAINARDAMPQGGTLLITTSVGDVESAAAAQAGPAGLLVTLSVSDTGAGIASDVKDRIFEPFFTTKPVGSGTGLGLSVVHGIITQADGFIDVESTPGKGTTFHIRVPLAARADEVVGNIPARAGVGKLN